MAISPIVTATLQSDMTTVNYTINAADADTLRDVVFARNGRAAVALEERDWTNTYKIYDDTGAHNSLSGSYNCYNTTHTISIIRQYNDLTFAKSTIAVNVPMNNLAASPYGVHDEIIIPANTDWLAHESPFYPQWKSTRGYPNRNWITFKVVDDHIEFSWEEDGTNPGTSFFMTSTPSLSADVDWTLSLDHKAEITNAACSQISMYLGECYYSHSGINATNQTQTMFMGGSPPAHSNMIYSGQPIGTLSQPAVGTGAPTPTGAVGYFEYTPGTWVTFQFRYTAGTTDYGTIREYIKRLSGPYVDSDFVFVRQYGWPKCFGGTKLYLASWYDALTRFSFKNIVANIPANRIVWQVSASDSNPHYWTAYPGVDWLDFCKLSAEGPSWWGYLADEEWEEGQSFQASGHMHFGPINTTQYSLAKIGAYRWDYLDANAIASVGLAGQTQTSIPSVSRMSITPIHEYNKEIILNGSRSVGWYAAPQVGVVWAEFEESAGPPALSITSTTPSTSPNQITVNWTGGTPNYDVWRQVVG